MDVGDGSAAGRGRRLQLQLQGRRLQSRYRRKFQRSARTQLAGNYGNGEQQMTNPGCRDKDSKAEIHQKRTRRLLVKVLLNFRT
jgi:hypothetical protein